jgi:hypothetical protein
MSTVVQIDMTGNELKSLNRPVFASSKAQAKEILGSSRKIDDKYVLVADSVRRRAYILDIDTDKAIWEYRSDKYIVDFQLVEDDFVYVDIYDDHVENPNRMIRQGQTVTWRNYSSKPVSVVEGYTTYDLFASNADLDLYTGGDFASSSIPPHGTFSYKFVAIGKYYWFIYPDILTGYIDVKRNTILDTDQFLLIESDNLSVPFGSRITKIDVWGSVIWSYGEAFVNMPRDVRNMINRHVLVST